METFVRKNRPSNIVLPDMLPRKCDITFENAFKQVYHELYVNSNGPYNYKGNLKKKFTISPVDEENENHSRFIKTKSKYIEMCQIISNEIHSENFDIFIYDLALLVIMLQFKLPHKYLTNTSSSWHEDKETIIIACKQIINNTNIKMMYIDDCFDYALKILS
jgi:hypothetical protein